MIQVSKGQSLIDVCLQELGTVAGLFELADANGLAITSSLSPGQVLKVPASLLATPAVVAYYASRRHRVNVPDPIRGAGQVQPEEPGQLRDWLQTDYTKQDFL